MKDNHKGRQKFPVREGTGDSSILNDKKPAEKTYPKPEKKIQEKNQPEYIEEQPNRKSPNNSKQ